MQNLISVKIKEDKIISKTTTVKNSMKVFTVENTRWSYANVWDQVHQRRHSEAQCQPDHSEERHQDRRQDQGSHRGRLRRG